MRFHLLAILLMAGAAAPAFAQSEERTGRRLDKLEQEMRAVQRRVFPGGVGATVDPEISPEARAQPLPGSPASAPVADLTARLDALERQLAGLTGQVEQGGNRIRQLEEAFARYRAETDARLTALEAARAAPPTAAPGPATAPAPPSEGEPAPARAGGGEWVSPPRAPGSAGADSAEQAYNAGFRLWEQRRYAQAREALMIVTRDHPRSRWASWANNLIGRAYLDEGDATSAARVLLANYQGNPQGERAADSLYYLGQALVKLEKRSEACKVYKEMEDAFGASLRATLRDRLPAARREARCT
jgi:TolA-binding protein